MIKNLLKIFFLSITNNSLLFKYFQALTVSYLDAYITVKNAKSRAVILNKRFTHGNSKKSKEGAYMMDLDLKRNLNNTDRVGFPIITSEV